MARSRAATALGAFIRQQRQVQHMSMRQLAAMAGISNPYLSQIERGLRAPSERVLDAIASTLEMSADALREGAGVPPPADGGTPPVVSAILADDRLTAAQRRALLQIYDAFTA